MMLAMMIIILLLTKTAIPSNVNMMYEARLLTMPSTISTNACAALLLLQLLAFVFATVVTVVLNVSGVCTVAVAVAVLNTVIFPLWTHATSLMKDTKDVEMS